LFNSVKLINGLRDIGFENGQFLCVKQKF
jgi:hypothetical protein